MLNFEELYRQPNIRVCSSGMGLLSVVPLFAKKRGSRSEAAIDNIPPYNWERFYPSSVEISQPRSPLTRGFLQHRIVPARTRS